MKLRTKLLVAVLGCIIAVCCLSQLIQQVRATTLMRRLADQNLAKAEQTQWDWLGNLQDACEDSLIDLMARGEMDRFQEQLDHQSELKDVQEISLASRQGMIAYSSDAQLKGRSLPADLLATLQVSGEPIHRRVDGSFEIFKPLTASAGCIDCHGDMEDKAFAGVLHFRFASTSLEEAREGWIAFVDELGFSLRATAVYTGMFMIAVVAMVLAYCIRRLVAGPLERMGEALRAGAEEVRVAAGSISAASQTQAEGATQQAAALEETSASIEEISSMTRHNAGHAANARRLAGEARAAAEAGASSMERMRATMREIEASNGNVRDILKSIDEIAFQTNIHP